MSYPQVYVVYSESKYLRVPKDGRVDASKPSNWRICVSQATLFQTEVQAQRAAVKTNLECTIYPVGLVVYDEE